MVGEKFQPEGYCLTADHRLVPLLIEASFQTRKGSVALVNNCLLGPTVCSYRLLTRPIPGTLREGQGQSSWKTTRDSPSQDFHK